MKVLLLGVSGLLLLSGISLAQEPVPLGDQFPVNNWTSGRQAVPAVTMDGEGKFVVTWESYGSYGSDPQSRSIQARRFAADGTPLAGQFQVNTHTPGTQRYAEVAADQAGRFMVVWLGDTSSGDDNSNDSIHGRVFDSTGTAVDDEFQVNSYTTSQQRNPQVAAVDDGGFVVVWSSDGSYGPDTAAHSIQAQRYAADGAPVELQFQVNSYSTSFQANAAVSIFDSGGFVVVWDSEGSYGDDSSSRSVQAQILDSDGDPVGGEFQVNTYTTSYQDDPDVATNGDDTFMVVWKSAGSSGTDSSVGSIQGQVFQADGTPIGGEFQVNTYTSNNQERPQVAADAFGTFVVTWYSFDGYPDSDGSIEGQRYRADGTPLGEQFLINSYTTGGQEFPAIAAGPQIAFVWNGPELNGRRFSAAAIFVDGFESGDTSEWSSSTP